MCASSVSYYIVVLVEEKIRFKHNKLNFLKGAREASQLLE